jgi:hypothetical protein
VKVYPDKPEFRDTAESSGIRAVRRDQYAMIGIAAGDVELPTVELPWYNIDAQEWQVASLPGSVLTILPSANVAPPPEPVAESEPVAANETPVETEIVYVDFWRYVSAGLGGVWLMTIIAWWWSRRPVSREPKEPAPPPIHKQQAKFLKAARKAALDGDAAGVKAALLDWGRLEWPGHAPRSIGDLARRVSLPLSTQLESMCSATYGPAGEPWDGEAIAKSLRSFSVLTEEAQAAPVETLPPLSPVT